MTDSKEENKENLSIVSGKVIKTDIQSLQFQICTFSEIYTQNKIFEIFGENSELLFVNSEINGLDLNLQKFAKYLMDIKSQINILIKPNTNEYRQWKIAQMCQWISWLENGRFRKYETVFRNAFISDGIDLGAYLPDLDVLMLRIDPFGVTNFVDRRDLAKHFKSLKTQPQRNNNKNTMNNEGAATEYH